MTCKTDIILYFTVKYAKLLRETHRFSGNQQDQDQMPGNPVRIINKRYHV